MWNCSVNQQAKIGIDPVNVPREIKLGETMELQTQVMNLGRGKLRNVRAVMEADGLSSSGSAYIGDIEAGASMTGSMELTAEGLSGNSLYGTAQGKVTFYYEDEMGNELTQEQTFETSILSPVDKGEENEKEDDTGQWWIIMALIVSVLVVAAGVFSVKKWKMLQSGEGEISEKRMEELRQNKAVAKVSRQMDCPVSVMYGGGEAAISCTLISEEYLEEMFHTDVSAATKKIYMNETAFSDFQEQLQENNQEIADLEKREGVKELNVRYSVQEETAAEEQDAAKQYKSAKLIVVENREEDEEGFAYTAETDSRLQKGADSLRVQFAKHDLDGLQVGALRNLGYEIQNEDAVIAEEYELKLQQQHIRYALFSCGLCIAAVLGLRRKERAV